MDIDSFIFRKLYLDWRISFVIASNFAFWYWFSIVFCVFCAFRMLSSSNGNWYIINDHRMIISRYLYPHGLPTLLLRYCHSQVSYSSSYFWEHLRFHKRHIIAPRRAWLWLQVTRCSHRGWFGRGCRGWVIQVLLLLCMHCNCNNDNNNAFSCCCCEPVTFISVYISVSSCQLPRAATVSI